MTKGAPTPVERALVVPPESRVGTITAQERQASPLHAHYREAQDRESAYELLRRRAADAAAAAEAAKREAEPARAAATAAREKERMLLSLAGEAGNLFGGRTGRSIARGLMGGILGRRS